uniref:Clc-like protein 2 n=1 Tax=Plectus sambesii TaxID=2011161 RepID=A0A914UJ91_9BILA
MTGMDVGRVVALVAASVLMAIGAGFSIAAIISPAWQVVDLREYSAEHLHGLLQDCARTDRAHFETSDDDHSAPHCTYKFDFDENVIVDEENPKDMNSPEGEAEHHTFHAWQLVILGLIVTAILSAVVALFVACCTVCFQPCVIIFTILAFLSMVLSATAMGVFYVMSHRVENRFIQGVVGTYEQMIGHAYYYELVSLICFLLSFLTSIVTSYLFMYNRKTTRSSQNRTAQRDAPLLSSYRAPDHRTTTA